MLRGQSISSPILLTAKMWRSFKNLRSCLGVLNIGVMNSIMDSEKSVVINGWVRLVPKLSGCLVWAMVPSGLILRHSLSIPLEIWLSKQWCSACSKKEILSKGVFFKLNNSTNYYNTCIVI